MEIIVAWIVFPLVLTGLAVGWGALVQRVAARELPGALLPGLGLAAIIVAAGITTATEATAPLTTPLIAVVGVIGLGVALAEGLHRRLDPWLLACALGVFALYAAPIVLSGEATFAGYIKLDDTATWMAFTDRAMEHGRDLDSLSPSTYEATLAFNIADGYPLGVFLPLGVAASAVSEDLAWVVQPYMSWLAAVLALGLWSLVSPLIASRPLRAAVVAVAAQPALLLGYVLWGGIKEVGAAALIALIAALALEHGRGALGWRQLIPLAIACAALLHVLTLGGLVWIAPILVGALGLLARERGLSEMLKPAGILALIVAALAVPLLLGDAIIPPTSSPLDSETAQGNLVKPLSILQVFGIWLNGDFRLSPEAPLLTYAAIAIVLAAGGYGLVRSRGKAPQLLLYAAASALGMAALLLAGSPWVDAKALATASPAFLLLGLVGCVELVRERRALLGWGAGAAIVLGVLASSVLAYREVNLAPRDQLAELERIGEEIAGEGPVLITEYQPYATRHFLREADPEAPAELRRRVLSLAEGGVLRRGRSADTDELSYDGLLPYRTLVLRRGPSLSRPPLPFTLVSSGEYYEVWQRPEGAKGPRSHLGLGTRARIPSVDVLTARTAIPPCAEVLRLGREAGPRGTLVAARAADPLVVPLAGTHHGSWTRAGDDPNLLFPDSAGTATVGVIVPRAGGYRIWLGGSVRGEIVAEIDGRRVGASRHLLNNLGQWLELGAADLGAGAHTVELVHSGADLHPGSTGRTLPIGPLALEPVRPPRGLVTVPAARARSLCGRPWDWIEAGVAG